MDQKIKTSELKKFIWEFNFPNPNWSNLPKGFPYIVKEGLTREEGHLLDAIVLAWSTSTKAGRKWLFFNSVKPTLSIMILISTLIGTLNLLSADSSRLTKPVQATTYRIVDEIIQSTMSAILRK